MTTAKPSTPWIERDDVLLWLFISTPVLAWIAAEGLSFLATRSLCASGRRWILYLVMGPAFAVAAAAGAASWTKWRGFAKETAAYRRFMAIGGVFLAAICAVAILSLMIAAAIHRPCD